MSAFDLASRFGGKRRLATVDSRETRNANRESRAERRRRQKSAPTWATLVLAAFIAVALLGALLWALVFLAGELKHERDAGLVERRQASAERTTLGEEIRANRLALAQLNATIAAGQMNEQILRDALIQRGIPVPELVPVPAPVGGSRSQPGGGAPAPSAPGAPGTSSGGSPGSPGSGRSPPGTPAPGTGTPAPGTPGPPASTPAPPGGCGLPVCLPPLRVPPLL